MTHRCPSWGSRAVLMTLAAIMFICALPTHRTYASNGPRIIGWEGVEEEGILTGTVMIEAVVRGNPDSVRFKLQGPRNWSAIEYKAPFYFFGDDEGQPKGWQTDEWPDGRYVLRAQACQEEDEEASCDEDLVSFQVANQSIVPTAQPGTAEVTKVEGLDEGASLRGLVRIRARASNSTDQVLFEVNGPQTFSHTEYERPYYFMGNDDDEIHDWDTRTWPNGAYTMRITACTKQGQCTSIMRSFRIDNPSDPKPVDPNLRLTDIQGVPEGAQLRGIVRARARTSAGVHKVVFTIRGPRSATHTEWDGPYYFLGNEGERVIGWNTQSWPDGTYIMEASACNKEGACVTLVRNFSIANRAGPPSLTPIATAPVATATATSTPPVATTTAIADATAPVATSTPQTVLPLATPASGEMTVFRPTEIPRAAAEIVNPLRGMFRWRNNEIMPNPNPLPQPSYDAYQRYEWRSLEPEKGRYDFTVIERDAERARTEGRKLGLRVRALVSTKGMSVPDYIAQTAPRGWWHDFDDDGSKDTYVPDWNDPAFLEQVERLIEALGKAYNNDPRISYLDIGIYGNWGEWHMHNFPYPSPSGAQSMTMANRQRIVDMHLKAFPNKRLLAMSDDIPTLIYALERSPQIGWRRDSLGVEHFEKVSANKDQWQLIKDRWKTAPVVTEFFNPRRHSYPDTFLLSLDQVEEYHISLVSNGNTRPWSELSQESREAFEEVAKAAGFRFVLREMALPAVVGRGEQIPLRSVWSNIGVAPAYEPWDVLVQLRDAQGTSVWEGQLALQLEELLPTTNDNSDDKPVVRHDTFSLPNNLATGRYEVMVLVRDPEGYRVPLALAIEGRHSDGSYPLGTITVR